MPVLPPHVECQAGASERRGVTLYGIELDVSEMLVGSYRRETPTKATAAGETNVGAARCKCAVGDSVT